MDQNERVLNEDFLAQLIDAPSPTGAEERAQHIYRDYLVDIAETISTDVMGNVTACLNPQGSPKIMLAGHVDEVGLQVRYITEKGFIFVNQLGGLDAQITVGHRVKILTKDREILGFVGKKAIHLLKPDERKKVTELKDQYIDVGASSREEVDELGIRIGDSIVYTQKYARLGDKGFVIGRCFDDKIGVFIIAEALRLLKSESFSAAIYGVSTTQEEIGSRGAITATHAIDPDIGIALDVTFTAGTPDITEKDIGSKAMGKGPVIYRGTNINPKLYDLFVETAETEKIPYQVGAMSRSAGTDAGPIQVSRSGVITMLIGIPNRYMHTMNEVVHLDDVENTIKLLVAVLKKITSDISFIPE